MIYYTPDYVARLFPNYLFHGDREDNKIFLTFDDGPIPIVTPWVISLLAQYKIKATFFCVGENLKKHPEIGQSIIDNGHDIGNHTENHLNGWKSNSSDYIEDVRCFNNRISSKLFRPPYGKLKKDQASILKEEYQIIMWDILSGDYNSKLSPHKCLLNCTKKLRNGSIIVFHDSLKAEKNLRQTLPKFIEFAVNKKLVFSKF